MCRYNCGQERQLEKEGNDMHKTDQMHRIPAESAVQTSQKLDIPGLQML